MSNIVPFQPQNQLPAALSQYIAQHGAALPSVLSQGVGVQVAYVSFKGKVFRIKHGQNEVLMIDPQTRQPLQYLDVIIVDAKPELSKTFYANGYTEGSTDAPDCSSEDGIHPVAPPGKQVQSPDCRTCPWNAFGSKRSSDGVATNSKACADTRKIVVVPPTNIANEQFGGPMLLRVPAASLTGLAAFDRQLQAQGVPFFAVVTRITFDYTVAYPKLVFQALQYITDEQFAQINELRNGNVVKDILNAGAASQAPQLAAPVSETAHQAPPPPAPAPASQPVYQQAPPSAPAPVPVPAPQPVYQQAPPPAPAPQQAPPSQQQAAQQVVAWGTAPTQAAPHAAPQPAPTIPLTAPAQQPPQAPQTQFAPPPAVHAPVYQQAPPPAPQHPPVAQQAPPAQPVPIPQSVVSGIDQMFS